MLKTIIITIIVYSTITFIVSAICENDEVNAVLAYGPVGMFVWVLFLPWRKYRSGGFWKVDFIDKDLGAVRTVYSRSGEEPYQRLVAIQTRLQEIAHNPIEIRSERVRLAEYIKGRIMEMF